MQLQAQTRCSSFFLVRYNTSMYLENVETLETTVLRPRKGIRERDGTGQRHAEEESTHLVLEGPQVDDSLELELHRGVKRGDDLCREQLRHQEGLAQKSHSASRHEDDRGGIAWHGGPRPQETERGRGGGEGEKKARKSATRRRRT